MWEIELSREVQKWYASLTLKGIGETRAILMLLEQRGNKLGMPHSKPLGKGLFELRFGCEDKDTRITYTFQPERKIITLTQFHKQRNNEQKEIFRARNAKNRLGGR